MSHNKFLLRWSTGILLASFFWLSLAPMIVHGEVSSTSHYTTRELAFTNGDIQLGGTLYLPEGDGPFPAAVMMAGSGPDSRAPYTPDAKMLSEGGIAAFIFDKRGTGVSTGDWRRSSLDDLMADGLAAIALVQKQPEIDPAKVGIIGSSQGAWLAPFMAARSDQVAFLIQITGSATPLANQEMWDDGNSLKARGFSNHAIAMDMKALHLLYSSRGLIQRGILPLGDLWFVYYDPTLDPADAWPDVHVPALVMYSEQDATVPTRTSLNIVEEIWTQTVHPASRVVVFPNKGHALGGGSRNQDSVYSSLVTEWIKAATEGQPIPATPFPDTFVPPQNLRWYGIGANSTPWYAAAGFQLPLILVFLLIFVVNVVVSLLPRMKFDGNLHRFLLGLTGLVNIFLILGLLTAINYLLNADAESMPPVIPLSEWLFPLAWVSVVLALGLVYFLLKARSQSGKGPGRGVFTFMTLAAWAFILFLAYWGVFSGRL